MLPSSHHLALAARLRELQAGLPEARRRAAEIESLRSPGGTMQNTPRPYIDYLGMAEKEPVDGPYDDGGKNSTPARIDRALRQEALRLAALHQQAPLEKAQTTVARAIVYYDFLNG